MKKFISILLAIILVFSLCACTNSSSSVQEEETQTTTDNTVKIGFIYLHDEQSTYDLNFLTAAKAACEKLGVEYFNKVNIPEGQECYTAAEDLVSQGCSIIFADSFGHEDYMIQAAKDFPDVEFCHATGTKAHTEGLPNFHNAFASIYEGRYLAGVAAGLKLNEMIADGQFEPEEAVIGYVGAYPYAEVISGYTSFFLGARSICPTATMKVQFTGSWYDETAEKETARNLIVKEGCKLISQHADSMGAPTACEDAGVPNISYNGDTSNVGPNTFIISSRINWEPYFEYIINCVKNHETIATDWTGTINTGSVELTEVNESVAAIETGLVLEAIKEELIAGTLHVFDTSMFTVNGNTLDEYFADVDSDNNYEGDTQVIIDGYFHESEFRSAPYFDLNIDGITILGD